MKLRLWICSLVALPSAVKGFKFTDVDPKSPTLQPGGKVDLSITWEKESGDEKNVLFVLHLDSEENPFAGDALGNPLLAPTTQSPSQVTFNKVVAGIIGRWKDTLEIKAPDHAAQPGSIQAPPNTNQQVPQQTTSISPNDGTPSIAGTSTPTPTTSLATAETVNIEQTDTDTGATGSRTFSPAISFTSSYTTSSWAQNSRGSSQSTQLSGNGLPSPNRAPEASGVHPGDSDSNNKGVDEGSIIGGVIGGLEFLVIIILLLLCLHRRRSKRIVTTEPFNKEKMVGQGSKFEYPFAPEFNPAYTAPKPFTEDFTTLYTSRASSPVDTEALTDTGTGVTEKPRRFAWTDRQMEIEERVQQLQAQLIALHNQSKFHKSQGEERQIEDIREKIERLNVLKSGYWALEQSDERPREMVY
ncbi:hypothetical protein VNI00_015104 [Paramarasmius palmivorus]|uniref:Uncharacterized protein n=1 Tax=Paramarasmius palmivorus TaxID=297713 RepID=A0AAW0BNA6_9AGAR